MGTKVSRKTRVAQQKRIKGLHGAGSPEHIAAMERTRSAGKKETKKSTPKKKTPPHLVLRKEAEDQIARNKDNMRRATVREGLLAEAGVPFPHLTVHDRVASGKGIWETPTEREARATQTARATSMAIAEAGGIKEFNAKIDEILKEDTPDKDIPVDDDNGNGKKKRVTPKDKKNKPIVIKEREDVSRDRVRLTPQMTGGSEYLATDYDRPGFQDWSDLAPPDMPGLLGSAKAQQDLLGSGLAAYQPWAQPATPYQPPVGPTYATRASLLGSSPADAAAAVVNNQQNNQQLNNPLATDPNAWVGPGGQTDFMQFTKDNAQGYYPGRFQAAQDEGVSGWRAFTPEGRQWTDDQPNTSAAWIAAQRAANDAGNRVAGDASFNAGRGMSPFMVPQYGLLQPDHMLDQLALKPSQINMGSGYGPLNIFNANNADAAYPFIRGN